MQEGISQGVTGIEDKSMDRITQVFSTVTVTSAVGKHLILAEVLTTQMQRGSVIMGLKTKVDF